MVEKWTQIKPYGDDAYTYWISGIYKIVSYRDGEYLVFFIQDYHDNWGDHVSPPPDNNQHGKCWLNFDAAKNACDLHAASYTPKPKTIKRAAEIKNALMMQSKEYEAA